MRVYTFTRKLNYLIPNFEECRNLSLNTLKSTLWGYNRFFIAKHPLEEKSYLVACNREFKINNKECFYLLTEITDFNILEFLEKSYLLS